MKSTIKNLIGIALLVAVYMLIRLGLSMEDGMLLIVSPILIVLVYLYPHYAGLNELNKLIEKMDEDYNGERIPSKISYGIPFLTDFKLVEFTRRLGIETPIVKVINISMLVTLVIAIISTAYVNALVVFLDFGADFALLMKSVMIFSILITYVLKSIVIFLVMKEFSNIGQALTAIIHPVALLYMVYLVPHYVNLLNEIDNEENMGYNV